MMIRAARIEVRQTPDGYHYGVATAAPGKLAFFRQKRDGVDEFDRGRGRAHRVRRQGRHRPLHQQRRGAALPRRDAGRRDRRQPDHLRQHHATSSPWTAAPPPAGQPGRPRAGHAGAARAGVRAGAAGSRRAADALRAEHLARQRAARAPVEHAAARGDARRSRPDQPARGRGPEEDLWRRTVVKDVHLAVATARWWACSARTAPARPPPST